MDVNLTVTNILGMGRQKGYTEIYHGVKEAGDILNKVGLDIVVNQDFVEPIVNAIIKRASTGRRVK